MKIKSFLKKEVAGVLPFLFFVFTLFGASMAFGFLAVRLFPSFSLRGITVLRQVVSVSKEITSRGEEFVFMVAYNFLVLSFIFISSFLFGAGSLLFTFLRGAVAGASLSYSLGALSSFPLIFPYPVLETLFFLLPCAYFLKTGFEVFKKLLGMKVELRREAKKGIRAIFFFLALVLAANMVEIFFLSDFLP